MQASTFKIAWRNLGRNKRRTALAVGAIALGQLTLVFVNALMAGSFQNMVKTLTGPLVGHVQIHHLHYQPQATIQKLALWPLDPDYVVHLQELLRTGGIDS